MSRCAVLVGLAIIASSPVAAEPCGIGKACTIPGGEYFVALPEGLRKGAVLFLHGWGGSAMA